MPYDITDTTLSWYTVKFVSVPITSLITVSITVIINISFGSLNIPEQRWLFRCSKYSPGLPVIFKNFVFKKLIVFIIYLSIIMSTFTLQKCGPNCFTLTKNAKDKQLTQAQPKHRQRKGAVIAGQLL